MDLVLTYRQSTILILTSNLTSTCGIICFQKYMHTQKTPFNVNLPEKKIIFINISEFHIEIMMAYASTNALCKWRSVDIGSVFSFPRKLNRYSMIDCFVINNVLSKNNIDRNFNLKFIQPCTTVLRIFFACSSLNLTPTWIPCRNPGNVFNILYTVTLSGSLCINILLFTEQVRKRKTLSLLNSTMEDRHHTSGGAYVLIAGADTILKLMQLHILF